MAAKAAAVFHPREIDFFPAQAIAIKEKVYVAHKFRHGIKEFPAGGFEGLHGFQSSMVAEAPNIVALEFNSAPEQLVAPVAEQEAQFECLAFLHAIDHVARVFIHRLV